MAMVDRSSQWSWMIILSGSHEALLPPGFPRHFAFARGKKKDKNFLVEQY